MPTIKPKPTEPQLLLHTPPEELNQIEKWKLASNYGRGHLKEHFHELEEGGIVEETEQLAKSQGIYLEYNRAKSGKDKDFMYMIRISVPGGGAFNREQWRIIDEVSNRYTVSPEGRPSIRLTTRQNIQFHWVKKEDLVSVVRDIAKTGFWTLNGCGDNTRNVMGCPLSKFSTVYDAVAQAHKYGAYFELPPDAHISIFEVDTSFSRFDGTAPAEPTERFAYGPNLLNRKFKIAFSAAHRNMETGEIEMDNCVELRTNDLGVAPVIENGRVVAYQTYVGGGQGEKNGKPTMSALGVPFGLFKPQDLFKGLDSIVKTHQEWGDRKNRVWARLKYVINAEGVDWFRDRVKEYGAEFELPIEGFDVGRRMLHHGWHTQESNGLLAYGLYTECGRLIDRVPGAANEDGNGSTPGNTEKLKSLALHVMENYDGVEAMITPNQDLIFTNLDPAAKEEFEADLKKFEYGTRNGKTYSSLRMLSGACVGLPTCRLSYTESEQFEPELMDELEARGYGEMAESIGITGCERQCFRPATKTLGWVGQGPDMYMLKLGGDVAGRHQGTALVEGDDLYLRQVPRDQVANVTAALFDFYLANRHDGEDMGAFNRRMGHSGILAHLRENPATAGMTEKTHKAPYQPNV